MRAESKRSTIWTTFVTCTPVPYHPSEGTYSGVLVPCTTSWREYPSVFTLDTLWLTVSRLLVAVFSAQRDKSIME